MFDTVIAAIDDLDTGRDATALATTLASAQADLTLAHIRVLASSDRSLRRDATEELERLRDEWPLAAAVSCVEADSVRDGLHDLVAGQDADLLVVGTTTRDRDERLYLGTHTREALEVAPCPVAVAPPAYAEGAAALMRIGVAHDGSLESEAALSLARQLAAERGASLAAFEAVTPPLRDYRDSPRDSDSELLEPARRRLAALGDVEPFAEFDDDPAAGLRRFGASVDLLVLGSHDYTPFDHLLSGSVAQRVSDDASCPVLVLPSPVRSSPK